MDLLKIPAAERESSSLPSNLVQSPEWSVWAHIHPMPLPLPKHLEKNWGSCDKFGDGIKEVLVGIAWNQDLWECSQVVLGKRNFNSA